MIIFYEILSVLIILSSSFGQPGNVYFYSEINNEPTNCPKKESDVRLICEINGTASRMTIKRARDQKLLYTSPRASTSAEFLIENVQCADMGVYQCVIDNRHTETTALMLPGCPPLPCHQENTAMTVYADVNKMLQISLCVLVYGDTLNDPKINTVGVRRTWAWDYYENDKTSACFRNVTVVLKLEKSATEDYGGMSVRVYSSVSKTFYLDYYISVIPSGIVYSHPEINIEPTQCPEKDSDVILICKTNGTASRMTIKRPRDQKLLYTSLGASTSAVFLIENVQCADTGVYQCVIDNRHTETAVIVSPQCPPSPCDQENTTISVYADVNKPLEMSLCVLVYGDILHYIRINNVSVRLKASVNYTWSWDYYNNQETSACFRNMTITLKHGNWTTEDYGGMDVRVYSSVSETFYLDYNISVIPKEPLLEIEDDNETRGDNEVMEEKATPDDTEAAEKDVILTPPFIVIIAGTVVLNIVTIVLMMIKKVKRYKQIESKNASSSEGKSSTKC